VLRKLHADVTFAGDPTISLVAAGLGCSLVSSTAMLTAPKNVRFIPLEPGPVTVYRDLAMIWLPYHLNEHGTAFIAMAKSYVADKPHLLDPDAPMT